MIIQVLNTINAFTIKIDTKGISRQRVCEIADKVNEIEGFQVTEIVFIYSVSEAFIKVYSENRTNNELEEEIKKLDYEKLSTNTNL